MAGMKGYEEDGFLFDFSPNGDPFKGLLTSRFPELTPYTANVDLSSQRSRKAYAKEASEIRGINETDLQKALISLCSTRHEEVAAAQEREHKPETEDASDVEVSEEDMNERVGLPGVLNRFVADVAKFSGVIKEQNMLKLLALAAFSAQLDKALNGKPIASNVILIGQPGRGKNYLCDAISTALPQEQYLPFESASGKALYYAAEKDSSRFSHCWMYPNEAEGTDHLVETFRPLLSGGKAKHLTVNRDTNGSNTGQEFTVEGPISLTIPTVRNKLDNQLQSRMLVAELQDYQGRVADHSGAVSGLLSQTHVGTDYTQEIHAWHAALRSLTSIRKVVLPVDHKDFRFTSDDVSHGARLWTNVLGLMCAHAWLEQKNREVVELESGEKAIVATPEDYEVAYEVFKATCERSVVNLSDTHRKILDAVHALREEAKDDNSYFLSPGVAQRKIEEKSKELHDKNYVRQSSISENKTFLVTSAKLLRDADGGLALVEGADPSWWDKGDTLDGFPKPEQVRAWWTGDGPPDPDPPDNSDHHTHGEHDRRVSSDDRIASDHDNGLDKPNGVDRSEEIGDIGMRETLQHELSPERGTSTVSDDEHVQLTVAEIVSECEALFAKEPYWIPDDIHDDKKLYTHSISLCWASPLSSNDGLHPDSVFEALKDIFKEVPEITDMEVSDTAPIVKSQG